MRRQNETTDDEKNEFYEQLQTAVDKCNRRDVVIAMGNPNAKVRDDSKDMEDIMAGETWTG